MFLIKNKTVKLTIDMTHQLCFTLGLHLQQHNHYFNANYESIRKYQKVPSKIKTLDLKLGV